MEMAASERRRLTPSLPSLEAGEPRRLPPPPPALSRLGERLGARGAAAPGRPDAERAAAAGSPAGRQEGGRLAEHGERAAAAPSQGRQRRVGVLLVFELVPYLILFGPARRRRPGRGGEGLLAAELWALGLLSRGHTAVLGPEGLVRVLPRQRALLLGDVRAEQQVFLLFFALGILHQTEPRREGRLSHGRRVLLVAEPPGESEHSGEEDDGAQRDQASVQGTDQVRLPEVDQAFQDGHDVVYAKHQRVQDRRRDQLEAAMKVVQLAQG